MAWTLEQFQAHLERDALKPVYLLAGEEPLRQQEAADALRARARELGYSEREILDVEAHFDWNRLAGSGGNLSLFATLRLIELRLPSGRPGIEGAKAISAWCQSPPPDTVLLITAGAWSKGHEGAWTRALEQVGVLLPIWPLRGSELPQWIGRRMRDKGLRPDNEAVLELAERVEGNLLAAAQEIDKLVLVAGSATLSAERLRDLVADQARFNVFDLTDAALAGDGARALRIVAGLRAEGESVPGLVPWLANQLGMMARLSAEVEGGKQLRAAMQAERVFGPRQQVVQGALRRGPARFWQRCLADLGRVERLGKGRGEAGSKVGEQEPWIALERLLARVAVGARRAAALAER
ncbi:MAG TPA: DNA polymerase III subunit delta [Xanthomonadaceae bacterium]|nr:DNA polymerase III subunit delta [Xanthomonadaceae bacterium]